MDWKLEVIAVPVTDVDRAKSFYADRVGFDVDHDAWPTEDKRVVQLTPPGSACSIQIGTGITGTAPGSLEGLVLVVPDMDAAHAELDGRGVEVSEIVTLGRSGRPGFRFAYFSDPDGNAWTVQEIRRD